MKHPPYDDCPACHGEGKIEVTVKEKGQLYGHKEKWNCWRCRGSGHLPLKATGEH